MSKFYKRSLKGELTNSFYKNESTHDLTVEVSSLDRTSSDSGKPATSQSGFYRDKKVLVAGGTGMIGACMVNKLLQLDSEITIASLESKQYAEKLFGEKIKFIQTDLTDLENCLKATKRQELVFNLVGIKGSIGIGLTKAASFLVPMLRFQTNLMDGAFKNGVKGFLFTSSICAYPKSNKPKIEDSVWDGQPKQNDRIPGLAKRIGEIQAEAYLNEFGWKAVKIVRPSNVYGPLDDFNPSTAQVIPALIARMVSGENPVKVWGDGSAVRDFIFVEDVVDGMLLAMEKANPADPVNLGSGKGVTIKQLAETIAKNVRPKPKIEWDKTKPSGDPFRVLSMQKTKKTLKYQPKYTLEDGIKKTLDWYLKSGWYEKNKHY